MSTPSPTPAKRYPLTWPLGWPRTPVNLRRRAHFGAKRVGLTKQGLTMAQALERLQAELRRLHARAVIISTNVPLRNDGMPYSGAKPADGDPGVAVYFQLHKRPRALASDKWDRVEDNVAAVAAHIAALRAIDRYGIGTVDQAFAGYLEGLPPAPEHDWWIVLGVPQVAGPEAIRQAFERLAKERHPDVGGSHDEMARLVVARDAGLRARGAA